MSVTASPKKPVELTLEVAAELQANGFRTAPHFAARMISDGAHLQALLDEARDGGMTRVFVIAGDEPDHGEFPDSLALLRAMADLGHPFAEIGIGCHPEGHPFIPAPQLNEALREKAQFAHHMTTQICFDPAAILSWIRDRRREGITLPVHIGAVGSVEVLKLINISMRIGIGDSLRFLTKNTGLVRRFLRPGPYRPNRFLEGLAAGMVDPEIGLDGVHLYTFNQIAPTVEWLGCYRDDLAV